MKSERELLLSDLIAGKNEESLRELEGVLSVDYDAIRKNCLNGKLPDELKYREAVLLAFTRLEPVNYSKLSGVMGISVPTIKKYEQEMALEINEEREKNLSILAQSLDVADYRSLFDPKSSKEKNVFVRKHVLKQEIDDMGGVQVNINGNVMIINSDKRKQIANFIQRGPLNQGRKPELPKNINLTPEFLDEHVSKTQKIVAKKLKGEIIEGKVVVEK